MEPSRHSTLTAEELAACLQIFREEVSIIEITAADVTVNEPSAAQDANWRKRQKQRWQRIAKKIYL